MEYKTIIMKRALRVIATIVLLLAMYCLLQILFLTVATTVSVFFAASSGSIPPESLEFINDAQFLKDNPAVDACVVNARAFGIFLSTLAMLFFIHFSGYYKLRWGILRSVAPKPLLISTLLVFSSMFALNVFVQWFSLDDNLADVLSGLSHNVLGILGIAVLAPLLEEVLFRGAIQGVMMRFFGSPWLAIIVSALVFGIFHWNPIQVVYATLLGIVFGWIYYRTGSLLSVIVGHVLNNSIAVITTIAYGATEEEAVAQSSIGIVGFIIFASLSVYFAIKLNNSLPPVEKTLEE